MSFDSREMQYPKVANESNSSSPVETSPTALPSKQTDYDRNPNLVSSSSPSPSTVAAAANDDPTSIMFTNSISRNKPHTPSTGSVQFRNDNGRCLLSESHQYHHPSQQNNQYVHLMDESDAVLQAVVFVEDANTYRSIHHKVDTASLKLYRFHYSRFLTCIRYVTIIILHSLAFFEFPSSLSWSSSIKQQDPRIELSCLTTQSVEMMCLLLLAVDLSTKIYAVGLKQFLASKWMIADVIVLLVSFIDWSVSVSVGCNEVVRVRRMLRPFFILQHSSLMKKIVNCLRRTVPEVFSILLMLAFHLYVFSLLGMLIFPQPPQNVDWKNITKYNVTNNTILPPNTKEEKKYFKNLSESFMSMLILLTTANNPDIMMPAYNQNRLYSIYFVLFLAIGLYCFMNMLTAVIYNQFRGYFLNSMQSSLFRRRVAIFAAFSVLNQQSVISESSTVELSVIQRVIEMADLSKTVKSKMHQKICVYSESFLNFAQFKDIFSVIDRIFVVVKTPPPIVWVNNTALQMLQRMANHIYFLYFSMFIACLNVILLTVQLNVQYEKSMASTHTLLMAGNFVFLIYYVMEQFLKIWAAGIKRYFSFKGCVYDCGITLILVVVQMVTVVLYGLPFSNEDSFIEGVTSLRNLIRLTNILIIIRLIRIIPLIKTLALVASTLLDLVQNLKAFAGILVVIFYSYALLGMELFQGAITYNPVNNSESTLLSPQSQLDAASKHHSKCGSYQQLEYWANNFDDFASSLMVLWDIMVVNNWQVFLSAYASATSKFSYLYFVFWWLFSVVIVLNLLTALILENFIMKWDRLGLGMRDRTESMEETTELLSLHAMFRRSLEEPSEQDLLMELRSHSYISLN
ncbi:two pore calcium channel protein 2-like [Octopus sinensis]|uniref:Two pore calcium channel protein 2-like n=1 Tax=Octopus sinensis TaxID=2607531 RepID=A0A6P7T6B1_9MOLL|nr:two pore calcium channel protein 2-like [Octopus sinensis]